MYVSSIFSFHFQRENLFTNISADRKIEYT